MQSWYSVLLFVLISLGGWRLFEKFRIPAAAILGGMSLAIIANLLLLPMCLPLWLRFIMSVSMGISIGSKYDVMLDLKQIKCIALFITFVICGSLLIGIGLYLCGVEKETAMFSGLLGGLTEMTYITQEFNFDSFQVSIFQTLRMVTLLSIVPLVAKRMPVPEGKSSSTVRSYRTASATIYDWLFIIGAAALAAWLLTKIHLPVGKLIGSATVTAVYSWAKKVKFRLNTLWNHSILSFVGGSAGMGITMMSLRALPNLILPAVVFLVLLSIIILAVYVVLRSVGKMDKRTALFSATMGGLTPSIALSEAMGADSAVVSTFQIIRYFVVIILAVTVGYFL